MRDEGRGGEGGGERAGDASNFWDEALFQVVISSLISLSLPTAPSCPHHFHYVWAAGTFPLPASFGGRHCMYPQNCLMAILHLLL